MSTVTPRERNGRKTWEARVSVAPHKPLSKTFQHNEKKLAERWAADKEASLRRGEKISVVPGKTLIADLIEDFLAEQVVRDKDGYPVIDEETDDNWSSAPFGEVPIRFVWKIAPWRLHSLRRVSQFIGELTVEQLTSKRVEAWLEHLSRTPVPKQKRKEGGKAHSLYDGDTERLYTASAIRKLYHALKDAVTWHARRHDYSVGDRFEGFKLPGSWEEPRNRRLEAGEEERLLAACGSKKADPEAWRLLIRLALSTAMRAQELLGMQWREVRGGRTFIGNPAKREKTGTARSVTLGPEGRRVIEELWARRSPDPSETRVFWGLPAKTTIMGRAFKAITKQAGIEDLRFHDLRHEACARFRAACLAHAFHEGLDLFVLVFADELRALDVPIPVERIAALAQRGDEAVHVVTRIEELVHDQVARPNSLSV